VREFVLNINSYFIFYVEENRMPKVIAKKTTGSRHNSGFTLIELMIAVVIVGILASVAVVSYRQHVLRSHRVEAQATLRDYAAKQERFFSRNNAYAATPAALNVPAVTGGGGRYTIAMASNDGFLTNYSITATAAGDQMGDTDCRTFTLTSLGVSSATDSGGAASDCW
jgi:type IV pilus assembly protein PilE